jgi:hypothetical protein
MWQVNSHNPVCGFGHKLYMDNFFSSPDLYDDLAHKNFLLWDS